MSAIAARTVSVKTEGRGPQSNGAFTEPTGAFCKCGARLRSYSTACETCYENALAALRRGREPGFRRCQVCDSILPDTTDKRRLLRTVCEKKSCYNTRAKWRMAEKRLDEREARKARKCAVCGKRLDPNAHARKLTCGASSCYKLRISEHLRDRLPKVSTRSRICPTCKIRFIPWMAKRTIVHCSKKCRVVTENARRRAKYRAGKAARLALDRPTGAAASRPP